MWYAMSWTLQAAVTSGTGWEGMDLDTALFPPRQAYLHAVLPTSSCLLGMSLPLTAPLKVMLAQCIDFVLGQPKCWWCQELLPCCTVQ